jgi:hypothetical protein
VLLDWELARGWAGLFGCCSSRFHELYSVHAKLLSLMWSEAMEAERAEEEEEESA